LPNYEARGGVAAFARSTGNTNQWQGFLGESSFEANSFLGGATLNDLNNRTWTNAANAQRGPGNFPVFDYQNNLTGDLISVKTSYLPNQAARLQGYLDGYQQMVDVQNSSTLSVAANNLQTTPLDAAQDFIAQDIRNNPQNYPAGWDPDTAADHIVSNGLTTDMLVNQRSARPFLDSLSPSQIEQTLSPELLSANSRGWGTTVGSSAAYGGLMGAGVATVFDAAQILYDPSAHPDAGRELGVTAGLGAVTGAGGAAIETTVNAQLSSSAIASALGGDTAESLATGLGRGIGGGVAAGPAAAAFTVGQMYFSGQDYSTEDYEAAGARSAVAGTLSGALAAGVVGAIWGSEVPLLGNAVGFAVGFGGYMFFNWALGPSVEDIVRGPSGQLGDYEAPSQPSGFGSG
jgi:hypothetical protein